MLRSSFQAISPERRRHALELAARIHIGLSSRPDPIAFLGELRKYSCQISGKNVRYVLKNVSAIARDAGVARATVNNHFDLLVDTLIGFWLPPWKLKAANKQVSHSKFYD